MCDGGQLGRRGHPGAPMHALPQVPLGALAPLPALLPLSAGFPCPPKEAFTPFALQHPAQLCKAAGQPTTGAHGRMEAGIRTQGIAHSWAGQA